MARSKFDEFMNGFDKKTGGRYTYYYRRLWDICQYASEVYENNHKASVWEVKKDKDEWVRSFTRRMKDEKLEEGLQKSVEDQLKLWMEAV